MKGSEKQITWAKSLIEKATTQAEYLKGEFNFMDEPLLSDEQQIAADFVVLALSEIDDANEAIELLKGKDFMPFEYEILAEKLTKKGN